MKLPVFLVIIVFAMSACSTISGRVTREEGVAPKVKNVVGKSNGAGEIQKTTTANAFSDKIKVGTYGGLDTSQLDKL